MRASRDAGLYGRAKRGADRILVTRGTQVLAPIARTCVSNGTLRCGEGLALSRPMPRHAWMSIAALTIALTGCASRNKPATPGPAPAPAPAPAPTAAAPATVPRTTVLEVKQGLASYYGPGFEGKITASGARFDANSMVAAHPNYPFGTVVRVTNLRNDRSVKVRIVDRGPVARLRREGVIIDVSRAAAEKLGFISRGRTRVRVEVLDTPGGTS